MIDFIQENLNLDLFLFLINVIFHHTLFSLSFIDVFQYHMTNPRHAGNPQILALGLFVGKMPLSEHKIDQICNTLVICMGTRSNFWGWPYIVSLKFTQLSFWTNEYL